MSVTLFWESCSVLLALSAGTLIGSGIKSLLDRSRNRLSLTQDKNDWKSAVLYKGIKPLIPISNELMRVKAVKEIAESSVQILRDEGEKALATSFISVLVGVSLACGIAAFVLSRSLVCSAAVLCASFLWLLGKEKAKADKRSVSMRASVPDALRSMETAFKSGHSLAQTLKQVSVEIEGPLGKTFEVCANRLEMGAPTSEALAVMRNDRAVPELSFIAVALDVQHVSGGSIAPVLESARESVKDELDLMRSLRVHTAQAKLSANIVTVMPFILVAFFSFMSPDFLSPFFSSFIGVALLSLALIMQLAGVLIVRRMLNKDSD